MKLKVNKQYQAAAAMVAAAGKVMSKWQKDLLAETLRVKRDPEDCRAALRRFFMVVPQIATFVPGCNPETFAQAVLVACGKVNQ